MDLTDQQLELMLKNKQRKSYADLAEEYLGDRNLGSTLRSSIRAYKRRNGIHTILDPIDKLFDDPIITSEEPTLVISDTHAPYQNKDLLLYAFNTAKTMGIKQLVHAGDLIDAACYNAQNKHEITSAIETDIAHGRSILYTAKTVFDRIYILPGNHDWRAVKKHNISFKDFINEDILDDKYIDCITTTEYDYLFYGDFAVIGHLSSGYDPIPGNVAAELAMKYNKHCIVGHDHLHGVVLAKNDKWGISIGGMFMHNCFWYKQRSYNCFPFSSLGFVILKDHQIYHYDEYGGYKVYGEY